jgi:hypothetical protein
MESSQELKVQKENQGSAKGDGHCEGDEAGEVLLSSGGTNLEARDCAIQVISPADVVLLSTAPQPAVMAALH